MAHWSLEPFVATDLDTMTPRGMPIDVLGMVQQQAQAWGIYQQFPSFTLWRDAVPMVCCGVVFPWAGTGEVWAIVHEAAAQYPHHTTRTLGRLVRHYAGLTPRLQTTVAHAVPAAQRLMRVLGFLPLTCGCGTVQVLTGYGPGGEDCEMWLKLQAKD